MNERNLIKLVGNLCKDAEVVKVGNVKIAKFGIFVDQQKKEGQEQGPSHILGFERLIGKNDQHIVDILKKGKTVAIEGFFKAESFEDKQGNLKTTVKLIAKDIQPYVYKKKEENKEG